MKNLFYIIIFGLIIPGCSSGQFDLGKVNKEINKLNKKPPTNQEVIDGLKQALTIGSQNSSTSASKLDGYFKNPSIKIPFPPEAKKVEKQVRSLGMDKQVDEFILTLNRAAEDAAKQAAPIFVDAIKKMTITDGMNILKGSDTAATNYLRKTTTKELHDKFKPVIKNSIQKVDVTRYWNPIITTYNRIPLVEKQNPDLDEYITNRALSGLFFLVSQEETKIRKDPAARVTELLKKVFGSK